MRKRSVLLLILLFLMPLVTIQLTTVKASPKAIVVPDNYLTIQAAIGNASQGDIIFVKEGVYFETLVITKSISLIGQNKETTFINANNATENIIYINASNVSIENFTISNNKGFPYPVTEPDGIKAEYFSSGINITNNNINNIQYGNGIALHYSTANTIAENNITTCGGTAISIDGVNSSSIINNTIINNGFGAILSDESTNNTIIGNYFGNTTENYGLQLNNNCSNNTIISNTFAYNQWGLALEPPSSNIFYHNNFIQNTIQALLFGNAADWGGQVNYWNNSKEGNYWSDYTASEIDHTGIGNLPYPIIANWDGSTVYLDNYPLISPYNISSTTPIPTPTTPPNPTPTPTPAPSPSPNIIVNPSPPTSTPTPTIPPATPTPNSTQTIIQASTNGNSTVNLTISGNITSSQISNAIISTNQSAATSTVSFILTGQNGTFGFGNLTIPKNAVSYGTSPTIYIDDQRAQNQNFTQDNNNYYVWYLTHFSTHQISIIFTQTSPPPNHTTAPSSLEIIYGIIVGTAIVAIVLAVTMFIIKGKRKQKSPKESINA